MNMRVGLALRQENAVHGGGPARPVPRAAPVEVELGEQPGLKKTSVAQFLHSCDDS